MLTPRLSLSFDGRCEAAFHFYEERLGGTLGPLFRWGGSPLIATAPDGWETKVLNASIRIGDLVLTGSDVPADRYEPPTGFQLLLELNDPAEADRVFDVLAVRGTVMVPLEQTLSAARFGVLTDQFGVPWSINCDRVEPATLESDDGDDEGRLKDLEQQIARAWLEHDRSAILRILAPEWAVTQADGSILTRSEVLGAFFDTVHFDSSVIDDVTVTLFGECAVVRGRTSVSALVSGQPVSARIRFTDVFVKREGEWRVVASHASSLGS